MNKNVKERAITLIALVITIVVLSILAGVAISLSLGENGLLNKAKTAKEEYSNAQVKEQEDISNIYSQLLIATDGTVTANAQQLKSIILDIAYPVGSIYMTTTDSNPASTLGGEWEAYAQGRAIVGVGTGNDGSNPEETFNIGDTGGEYKHQLTEDELPSISGTLNSFAGNVQPATDGWAPFRSSSGKFTLDNQFENFTAKGNTWAGMQAYGRATLAFGNDQSHNNTQPYIATYLWKRTK